MTASNTDGATRTGLSDRVDTIGWGTLFLAIGLVSLVPSLPDGAWLIAAGLVLLGSSVVRARLRLPVWDTTVVIGIAALGTGIFIVAGLTTEVVPLVLIVLGLTLVGLTLFRAPRTHATPLAPTR
jgi:hypothetical protein